MTSEPTISTEDTGGGRPIILLHGLTATRRYVLQGSRHLRQRGYRLVAYDARGHGDSGAPSDPLAYGYDMMVSDLERVLATTGLDRESTGVGAERQRPVLVGSSMGAHVATAFALDQPERVAALVQITPAFMGRPRTNPAELAHWDALADALDQGDIGAFMSLSGTDAVPERFRSAVELGMRQRLERHRNLRAVAASLRVVPRSSAWDGGLDRLADLAVPTLVVASRDEVDAGHPMFIAEDYARRIPRAELAVEEPGAPPLAWQGGQLSRRIGDFLEKVLPDA